MVYINEGDFYVGDGDATARLWDASDMEDNPAIVKQDPVVLRAMDYSKGDDDDLLKYSGIYVDGDEGIDMDGQSAVDNPNYPTGYKAFYCMKQEITNEQYAEFLNNLTREQQNGRAYLDISGASVENPFPINPSGHITYRNCVRYNNPSNGIAEPVNFFCDLNNNGIPNEPDDGQNVIICWIGWPDGAAYADWAGLRPMTELEFEKACRGPEFPVPGSYAWNTSNIFADTTYFFNDLGGKAEYPKNPGEGIYANASYAITTGHPGPVNILNGPTRAGIFATASSDRVNSGASYYGVLDLTGGINERCVTIGGDKGRHFQGTHGDGQLTEFPGEAGNATNTDWPGVVDTQLSNGVVGREGSGFRGGDWNDSATWGLLVSNRFAAAADPYFVDNPRNGNPGSGFRCVRSVK
jgi:formylglycine-generating enzyme required for sulfatase activity